MKTKIVLSTLAAAVALPLLAAPALADRDDDDDRSFAWGGRMLSRMDSNGDNKVSQDEFLARRMDMFKRMDTDGDGRLTAAEAAAGMPGPGTAAPAEMRAMHQAMMDGKFRGQDADGDGAISAEEFTTMPALRFAMMDANKDGAITADEMRGGKGFPGMSGSYGGMMGGHHGKGDWGGRGYDRD